MKPILMFIINHGPKICTAYCQMFPHSEKLLLDSESVLKELECQLSAELSDNVLTPFECQ